MHSFTEKTNTAADWLLVCRRNYVYVTYINYIIFQFSEIRGFSENCIIRCVIGLGKMVGTPLIFGHPGPNIRVYV